jgi:hypothetical protein
MSCTNSGVREKNKKKKIFFLLHVVRSEKSSKNACFFELQKCAKHRKKGGPHLPLLGDPPIYTVFKMPPAHSDFLAPTHQEIFAKISSSSSVAKKIIAIDKKKFYFFFFKNAIMKTHEKKWFFFHLFRRLRSSDAISMDRKIFWYRDDVLKNISLGAEGLYEKL